LPIRPVGVKTALENVLAEGGGSFQAFHLVVSDLAIKALDCPETHDLLDALRWWHAEVRGRSITSRQVHGTRTDEAF
jgi:hypothetical protein